MKKTNAILVLCLLLIGALSATEKPNVLFIAIDDLNDWVGCLGGHPQAITPNLDRFAGSGVLFNNAHCPAPACNPSRSAIMTGLSPNILREWAEVEGDSTNGGIAAKIFLPTWLLVGWLREDVALLH